MPRNVGEPRAAGRGIIAVDMQPIPVIGYPQVHIAIAVIVKERYRLRLPARIAHAVAQVVAQVGIIALKPLPRLVVRVHNRLAVRLPHPYLRPLNARALRRIRESQIPVVAIQDIELPILIRHAHPAKLVLREIAHIYVNPPVVVHIRARHAHSRARIYGIPKSGLCNVGESASAIVEQQPIYILPPLRLRPIVQPIGQAALRAHIQILIAVIVHIAGDNARPMRLPQRRARLIRHIAKRAIPLIAIQPVPKLICVSHIKVHIPIAVIVKHNHARPDIPRLLQPLYRPAMRDIHKRPHIFFGGVIQHTANLANQRNLPASRQQQHRRNAHGNDNPNPRLRRLRPH